MPRLPVHAVDEHANVVEVAAHRARVALGMRLRLGSVHRTAAATRDPVRASEDRLVEEVPRQVGIPAKLGQVLGEHVLVRQVVEDLLRALRGVPGSGEADDQGMKLGRHPLATDLLGDARERHVGVLEVEVLVRELERREWRRDPIRFEAPSERPERVQHPGVSREPSEEDEAPAAIVHDLLVVHERCTQVHQAPEHRHVRGLPLDDVREEQVRGPGDELRLRDLLHADDEAALRERGGHPRPHAAVRLVGERTDLRGLHEDVEPVADELRHVIGGQRHAPLPSVLRLASEADHRSPSGRRRSLAGRISPSRSTT
jgi:hypothetical protein